MQKTLVALLVGTLFGAGLALSDMVNPERVLAFLDVLGEWDATLAFVLIGALVPSALGYLVSRRMVEPLLHTDFHIPENRLLDRRLIAGGVIFGVGWGLAGYCPGPAIAGLVFGAWQTFVFVIAMLAGMLLFRLFFEDRDPRRVNLFRT